MTAKDYLIAYFCDDPSETLIIDSVKRFSHKDMAEFAESYYRHKTGNEQTTTPQLGYQSNTTYTFILKKL